MTPRLNCVSEGIEKIRNKRKLFMIFIDIEIFSVRLFIHAFIGCDTTSQFCGIGKVR